MSVNPVGYPYPPHAPTVPISLPPWMGQILDSISISHAVTNIVLHADHYVVGCMCGETFSTPVPHPSVAPTISLGDPEVACYLVGCAMGWHFAQVLGSPAAIVSGALDENLVGNTVGFVEQLRDAIAVMGEGENRRAVFVDPYAAARAVERLDHYSGRTP
jgi:hypothetical protein